MGKPSNHNPEFKAAVRAAFDEHGLDDIGPILALIERQTALSAAHLFGRVDQEPGSFLADDAAEVGGFFIHQAILLARELGLDPAQRKALVKAVRRGAQRYVTALQTTVLGAAGNAVDTLWTKERIASATLAALAAAEN